MLPKNALNILYFIMVGGSTSLGWNAISNSWDYFEAKYPNYSVTFVFPIAIYVAQTVSIFIIPNISHIISYHVRVLVAIIVNTLVTASLSLEAAIFEDTMFGMVLIMGLIFLLGFANNLIYASGAGFTNQLEPGYTAYFLIGVSVFGIVASSLKALTLWIFNPSSDGDVVCTLVYFLIFVLFYFLAFFLHVNFRKSKLYTDYMNRNDPQQSITQDGETSSLEASLAIEEKPKKDLKTILKVLYSIRLQVVLMLILYFEMDLPFPGVMLKKPMPGMANHTKTVSLMTTFTAFLLTGKKLGQYRQYYSSKTVIGVIIARVFLVAAFIIQAVTTSIPVFNTIWFAYVNVALFGVTMGFSSVSLFVLGAEQVEKNQKELAGFLLVFTLNIGSISAGFSSLLLKNIGTQNSS